MLLLVAGRVPCAAQSSSGDCAQPHLSTKSYGSPLSTCWLTHSTVTPASQPGKEFSKHCDGTWSILPATPQGTASGPLWTQPGGRARRCSAVRALTWRLPLPQPVPHQLLAPPPHHEPELVWAAGAGAASAPDAVRVQRCLHRRVARHGHRLHSPSSKNDGSREHVECAPHMLACPPHHAATKTSAAGARSSRSCGASKERGPLSRLARLTRSAGCRGWCAWSVTLCMGGSAGSVRLGRSRPPPSAPPPPPSAYPVPSPSASTAAPPPPVQPAQPPPGGTCTRSPAAVGAPCEAPKPPSPCASSPSLPGAGGAGSRVEPTACCAAGAHPKPEGARSSRYGRASAAPGPTPPFPTGGPHA